MPKDGRGYKAVRLSRHRWFGHPQLVDFITTLGGQMQKRRLGMLVVGDLSQPRGGPTPTGHRSHQTGLDVDLWYEAPPRLVDRENAAAPVVVDLAKEKLTRAWNARMIDRLALASADPRVNRIFVNPVVKRELCARLPGAEWLARIRPWWGHHDHFHVRLGCPADSPECVAQDVLPHEPDKGCGPSLAWWFSEEARTARQLQASNDTTPTPLPPACQALVTVPGEPR